MTDHCHTAVAKTNHNASRSGLPEVAQSLKASSTATWLDLSDATIIVPPLSHWQRHSCPNPGSQKESRAGNRREMSGMEPS